eukprot:CAMPEP_0202461874 /NCGR_PEP_ID=MMETSP1360-20130828/51466_1 /ASSEMBLY_ACC=CAM_ASM_000848 /TAXON_ID=515479 /ORGANISM="Licmophora paradoxa, Strain CCMP2313" /LENGTH=246 /DNA_ID=CAMNT_0049084115 /DNA_START=32 /DNA_END=772 /DNA_ORIENTATION=+
MRVYNVTKQGKDQDPSGVFIKKYIPELRAVDLDYIHEPWKMTLSRQKQANVLIDDHDIASQIEKEQETQIQQYRYRYPAPIVNEQETARQAKAKVAAVRKLESTKQMAQRVYNQHGSRNRQRDELNGRKPKALSTTTTVPKEKPQQTIRSMFQKLNSGEAKHGTSAKIDTKETTVTDPAGVSLNQSNEISLLGMKRSSSGGDSVVSAEKRRKSTNLGTSWSCNACTFINHKPIALACEVCATARSC